MTFVPKLSPYDLFKEWFLEAEAMEPTDHNAMSLATVSANGHPSVRIVLLKHYDENGFCFFTNTNSNKGQALAANPVATLNFYWKSNGRQVRISGAVEVVSTEEADIYFSTRGRDSQIGAWASQQSELLADGFESDGRSALMAAFAAAEQRFQGQDVPRPPHWSGYRVVPDSIEFWQAGDHRLHDRGVYERDAETQNWVWRWLYP